MIVGIATDIVISFRNTTNTAASSRTSAMRERGRVGRDSRALRGRWWARSSPSCFLRGWPATCRGRRNRGEIEFRAGAKASPPPDMTRRAGSAHR